MASTRTVTITKKDLHGTQKVRYAAVDVTSYDSVTDLQLTPGMFGLTKLENIEVQQDENTTTYGVWNGLLASGSASVSFHAIADGTETATGIDLGVYQFIARGK